VAQAMKSLLAKFFIDNWQRKLIALVLAMIIWIVINHSIETQKELKVPIKVINIPSGKTIEGLSSSGVLKTPYYITIFGNKNLLNELSANDLEIILDAEGKDGSWDIRVNKSNLFSFNPYLDIKRGIKTITHMPITLQFCNLVTERIPLTLTKPIGNAPVGYKFLDIWPYQLYITGSGPERVIKKLKTQGLKLTFNLSNISENELKRSKYNEDEVSFSVPSSWKKIDIHELFSNNINIDDPHAKHLRIDFVKQDLIPITNPIPVCLYHPYRYSKSLNPKTTKIENSLFINKKNNIFVTTCPLYARGASNLFIEVVKDMLQLAIITSPKSDNPNNFSWNVQFLNPHQLEDSYVAKVLSSYDDNNSTRHRAINRQVQEEYIRNRFRNYMNNFRLYLSEDKKLLLDIKMKNNKVFLEPK
jgi:hypothetical protein